jgi:hypothetical protein
MHQRQNFDRLRILDTTLRDGAQTPRIHLSLPEKYAIASFLAHTGVDIIEIGFAGNEYEIDGMKTMAKIGCREYNQSESVPIISCFATTGSGGKLDFACIDRAFTCLSHADLDRRMFIYLWEHQKRSWIIATPEKKLKY